MIILKQENREYDVDHNLLIKDINNIMLKGTSLEIDLEFFQFPEGEKSSSKYCELYCVELPLTFCVLCIRRRRH